MKKKLVVSLLLAVSITLVACAQQETVSEDVNAEEAPVEQVESVLESEPAPETEAMPEVAEEEQEEIVEEAEPTEEEKALAAFLGIDKLPDDLSDEEYEELVALMRTAQSTAEYVEQTQQPTTPAAPVEPPVEEPVVDNETGLTTRTDAEVKETINNFVDNFKNTSAFSNLTDIAAQHVDENLNTLKNNPESNSTLTNYINEYKNGSLSEDLFIYLIESWIRIGGPYGSNKISVQ